LPTAPSTPHSRGRSSDKINESHHLQHRLKRAADDDGISVTAQLAPMSAVTEARVRAQTGGAVKLVALDVVRIEMMGVGRSADCAAERVLTQISRALPPSVRLARPPVWVARRSGPLGVLRRPTTGRGRVDDDPDDGLGGVREPRRPSPSAGSAAAAVDPYAA
jgi:hypothetical protein